MKEKKCEHDWCYSPEVIATNPPIHQKICRKCGKHEEEQGAFVDSSEYYRLLEKFKEK